MTLFGTPNLYMMLLRNLTAASCVMFATGVASIYLVNVSIQTNKNLNPPGALGRMPTMSTSYITKGQERSMGRRGFTCFIVCFWKNCHSLHLVTISIASSLVNVLILTNKNLNPLGAIGRMSMMSTPYITKGQERSMGRRGFTCFVVCFWKNCHSLHLVTIFIASSLAVGQ
jgi:hypothetical protein